MKSVCFTFRQYFTYFCIKPLLFNRSSPLTAAMAHPWRLYGLCMQFHDNDEHAECTRDMSYANCLYLTELSSLQHRRQQQARDFFRSLLDPNSCLHSLLPTPRDPNLVTRLRAARRFPALASRTKKYQFFINFGLLNYQ